MMAFMLRKPCNQDNTTKVYPIKTDTVQVENTECEPGKVSYFSRLQRSFGSQSSLRKKIITVGVVIGVMTVLSMSIAIPLSVASRESTSAANKGTKSTKINGVNPTTTSFTNGPTSGSTNVADDGNGNSDTTSITTTNVETNETTIRTTKGTTNGITGARDFRSCADRYVAGFTTSGIYEIITPDNSTIDVYCEHGSTEGDSGWTNVFKAVSGVTLPLQSPSVLWLTNATSESPTSALLINSSSREHYKNRIIEQWEEFNPTRVRLSLYENKTEVVRLVFNATGSDKANWFARDRLLTSPWTDIDSQTINYFSIAGDVDQDDYKRTFFINSEYGGCGNDKGWMVLLEMVGPGGCPWESYRRSMFSILYSSISTRLLWATSDAVSVADMMAIYIR